MSKESRIEKAIGKVTNELVNSLDHGEEVNLTKHYSLYKYYDMEYYTIRDRATDEEELVVQFNGEGGFEFTEI